MPQIRQFTRTRLPQELINVRAGADSFGGNTAGLEAQARSLRRAAQVTEQAADITQDISLKRDRSKYYEQLSNFQLENETRLQELSTTDFEDGTDFKSTYVNDVEERASLLEVPGSMQEVFARDLAQMKLSFGRSGIQEQVRRVGVKAKTEWQNTVNSLSRTVLTNPGKKQEALDILRKQATSLPNMAREDKDAVLSSAFEVIEKSHKSGVNQQISNFMQASPAAFLEDAKDNPGKYTKKQVNEAKRLFDKQAEDAERQRIATAALEDPVAYDQFISGNMSLGDLDRIEAKNGETAFTKMARKRLTTAIEKLPKPPKVEQLNEFNRLQQRLNIIKLNAGEEFEISLESLNDFRKFQDEVNGAVEKNLISEGEGKSFLRDYSGSILSAIATDTSGAENTFRRGIQDPYNLGFKSINTYLKNNNRKDDLAAKKDLTLLFTDFLGDYQSSGDSKKDSAVVKEAVALAIESFARNQAPILDTLGGTPNSIVTDGEKLQVSEESDLRPDTTINVDFDVVEVPDVPEAGIFAGKTIRRFKDGRPPEIIE